MFRFLLLRRHTDPLLLSIAMASLVVKLGLEVFLFGFFACVGIYLICGLHWSSIRRIDWVYAVSAGLYGGGAVLIGSLHGNIAEDIRWIGYPLVLLLGVLLFPGFVLIPNPLRQLVFGARAGLIMAAVIGAVELSGSVRIGFGGNAANAALVVVITGVLARIPIDRPLPYLPNSRLWFYLAGIVVVMTGTRSVLPVFALALAVDLFGLRKEIMQGRMRPSMKRIAIIAIAAALGIAAVGYQLRSVVSERLEYTIADLDAAAEQGQQETEWTSLTIRLALWERAIDLIGQHPLTGLGGIRSMDEITRAIPASERHVFRHFNHVHNFILDELRLRGIIGLLLMLGFFGATLGKLFLRGTPDLREAALLFLATLLLYGSLHGLLLSERNMALIAIFISTTLLHLKNVEFRRSVRIQSDIA